MFNKKVQDMNGKETIIWTLALTAVTYGAAFAAYGVVMAGCKLVSTIKERRKGEHENKDVLVTYEEA